MAELLPLERSTRPLAFIAVFGSRIYKDGDEDALWYFVFQGDLRSASRPQAGRPHAPGLDGRYRVPLVGGGHHLTAT
jgi:hypothetical protein